MVDPSLLRLAADRGVTICFADLDGADGLWVPEERTVLVSRRLSEYEVAAVIEHELGHVAIDDRHADLDAGVRHGPPISSPRWVAAVGAAACLALVGGITVGLVGRNEGTVRPDRVVAPSAPPLTESPASPDQVVVVVRTIGPDGKPTVRTVTRTATAPVPTRSPAATSTPTATKAATSRSPVPPAPQPPAQTSPNPAPSTPSPPATTEATPTPTGTPAATSPASAPVEADGTP